CLAACCCFDQVLLDMGPRGESGRGDQEGRRFALPENPHMPSARIFAECIISSTRQSYYLPSAKKHALGEQMALGGLSLCRVPVIWHSAKTHFAECQSANTRQRASRAPTDHNRRQTTTDATAD